MGSLASTITQKVFKSFSEPEFNNYLSGSATGKVMLIVSLLIEDIKLMNDVIIHGIARYAYYYPLLAILALSMLVQIAALTIAFIVILKSKPTKDASPESIPMKSMKPPSNGQAEDAATALNTEEKIELKPAPNQCAARLSNALTVLSLMLFVLHVITQSISTQMPMTNITPAEYPTVPPSNRTG